MDLISLFLTLVLGTKGNLDMPHNAGMAVVEETEQPEIITFYSQQYEGDGIFYVIDKSGSMSTQGEFDIARSEVIKNIQQFSQRVEFGITFFSNNAVKFPNSSFPAAASPSAKKLAIGWIGSIEPIGTSCVKDGIEEAITFAMHSSAIRNVIIYVGDGGGTCRGGDEPSYLAKTLQFVRANNIRRAQINAIGIRVEDLMNDQFLRNLTIIGNGEYVKLKR
jgi:Mg-chelatase subunit ChlD